MLLTGILLLAGVCRKGRCSELPLNYRSTTAQLPLNYRSTTARLQRNYRSTTAQLPLNYRSITAQLPLDYSATTAQLPLNCMTVPLNCRSTTAQLPKRVRTERSALTDGLYGNGTSLALPSWHGRQMGVSRTACTERRAGCLETAALKQHRHAVLERLY